MYNDRPFILVFSGPPCSGKSRLLKHVISACSGITSFEMDEIREMELRGPIHDKARRSAAYRIMHFRATQVLNRGQPVALDATYIPPEYRAELAAIALRFKVQLYVVQCVCTGEEAVRRFIDRCSEHAGKDLTVTRVRGMADSYERFEGALTVDTAKEEDHVAAVLSYLSDDVPVNPVEWARHNYMPNPGVPAPAGLTAEQPVKLSERSLVVARLVSWGLHRLSVHCHFRPVWAGVYWRLVAQDTGQLMGPRTEAPSRL